MDGFNDALCDLSAAEPGVLDTDLQRLADALHDHLAYEEKHVCPLLVRFEEWPIH